jgi:hypothetical protein
MIGGLTVPQIEARMSNIDAWQATLLAKIVCSSYSREYPCVDLYTMAKLDADNFKLAVAIMNYRRMSGWSEVELRDLASWCLNQLHPSQGK